MLVHSDLMCPFIFFCTGNPAERGIIRWRKQIFRLTPVEVRPKDAYSFQSVDVIKPRAWFRYIPFLTQFDQRVMNVPSFASLFRRAKTTPAVVVTSYPNDGSPTHQDSGSTSRRNTRKSRKSVMFKADESHVHE